MTTIFFATDVHGSSICWKKFINAGKFYAAEVLILGGDMTGKAIVPIVQQGGGRWRATLLQQEFSLCSEEEVQEMEKKIQSRGYYPLRTSPDQISELSEHPDMVDELFRAEVLKTAEQWLCWAEEKLRGTGILCYVAPGNDDSFFLDDLIRQSTRVQLAEGRVMPIDDHHEMISSGWSNITPWHTYREAEEDDLLCRFQPMIENLHDVKNSVFNLHAPPYGSTLDEAPELTEDLRPKYAGRSIVPVGSHAVRKVIDQYQPLLGLFGHIHEAKGTTRLGRTLCINPGSLYEQGRLQGVLVNLTRDGVKSYMLTTG